VIFQMAEVAVPKDLFGVILARIRRLWLPPLCNMSKTADANTKGDGCDAHPAINIAIVRSARGKIYSSSDESYIETCGIAPDDRVK